MTLPTVYEVTPVSWDPGISREIAFFPAFPGNEFFRKWESLLSMVDDHGHGHVHSCNWAGVDPD
jgi:hypothetical protein